MSGRRGVSHYNTLHGGVGPNVAIDTPGVKAEFARRLQAAMMEKGWNQSELARRASKLLPKPSPGQKRGKAIGRDLISHYIRAQMLPGPVNLEALANALDKTPSDLMPNGVPSAAAGTAPFEMRGMHDGRVYLRVNRATSYETATKIMAVLAEDDSQ